MPRRANTTIITMHVNHIPRKTILSQLIASALMIAAGSVVADDIRSLPPVEVVSRYSLLGAADSANEGAVVSSSQRPDFK